ncbi:MAG TPA: SpoIIE family protein phosphatase, partial [Terriglobales bacterium]|nr:SpoIIE family protein phosphatase [Terriglobales bacterium]
PGDILLLATDGLTKNVPEMRVLSLVQSGPSLERACDELVRAARDAGGDDNITCVLVRIG